MSTLTDRRTVVAVAAALLLLAAAGRSSAQAAQGERAFIPGPVQEAAVIDGFTDRTEAWKPKAGSNVAYSVQPAAHLPCVATTVMAVQVGRKDLSDGEPGHNWFVIERDGLPAGTIPGDSDGLRFSLASGREVQWWIQVVLTTAAGETYSCVIGDHTFPVERLADYVVPLQRFRSKSGQPLIGAEASAIRGISFVLSSPGATLYLHRVAAYRREKLTSWLDFTTSHPTNNLFQRTDPVDVTFAPGGSPREGAAGFRYEIRDYYHHLVARGKAPLTGAPSYTFRVTPATHGYYEVSAFFTNAAGKDLEKHSCVRAEGSVPAGLGTFSVLPTTLRENIETFRKLGTKAFFGLHGDFHGLADAVGLSWRFDYLGWQWIEPQKPDRSGGLAPWVRERMAAGPQPEYRLHILPFRGNMAGEVPGWARRKTGEAPAFANWDDYLTMVRDCVKLEKFLYPHMKPRIYGGAWELNLNMPPDLSQPPRFTPEEAVELFRRFRETVKSEDPDGIVIGPCPSVLNMAWVETLFKAGVLQYLDAIETHGYCEGVFSPEANDYPGKIARLNALVRQYNHGKALPIYCTEMGYPGTLGTEPIYRSQAERMARTAVILKGEGVRVLLPFYGIDYDEACFGFLFNLDVDAPAGPWATKRVSPKPMVNAMATCVRLLEGAAPRGRIRTLGSDVWAYTFDRNGTTITALWTPGKARTVSLPVAGAQKVEVVDIMGHERRAPVARGTLRLPIDGAPAFVVRRIPG